MHSPQRGVPWGGVGRGEYTLSPLPPPRSGSGGGGGGGGGEDVFLAHTHAPLPTLSGQEWQFAGRGGGLFPQAAGSSHTLGTRPFASSSQSACTPSAQFQQLSPPAAALHGSEPIFFGAKLGPVKWFVIGNHQDVRLNRIFRCTFGEVQPHILGQSNLYQQGFRKLEDAIQAHRSHGGTNLNVWDTLKGHAGM